MCVLSLTSVGQCVCVLSLTSVGQCVCVVTYQCRTVCVVTYQCRTVCVCQETICHQLMSVFQRTNQHDFSGLSAVVSLFVFYLPHGGVTD